MKLAPKFRLLVLLSLFTLPVTPVFAQGCALCKANARATPQDAQRAINRAIFVMLAPPVGMMVFGAAFVRRYVKHRDEENDRPETP